MRQRVLIIDDSQPIHALVRARLRDEPIELLHAESGTEGLAAATTSLPDLILLDVDMPQPDGFEVCRRLKSDPATRDVQIIFLTGASSTEEKLHGLELGAIDYITKPFDPAELRARVRASLRTKQLLGLLAERAAVLQASEEQFRFLAENSSDVISRHGPAGDFLYASPASAAILGYEPQELVGRHVREIAGPEDQEAVGPLLDPRESSTVAFRARRKDGRQIWLEATSRAVRHPDTGQLTGLHMSSRDITLRKRAEATERWRARVLEMIAANHPLGEILGQLVLMMEDEYPAGRVSIVLLTDGRLEHAGPNLPPAFRVGVEEMRLRLSADVCSRMSRDTVVSSHDVLADPAWAPLRAQAEADGVRTCWATRIWSGAGDVVGTFAVYHPDRVEPDDRARDLMAAAAKLIMVATENRDLTCQLAYRAQHDSLTGLPNRLLLQDRMSQALARSARSGQSFAVLGIDLDRFKYVNDTFGHQVGDQLLVQFTQRLQSFVRQTDTLARMGGDEFTLLAADLAGPQDALLVAQKIIDVLKPPFELAGEELCVTGSVGVAIYPRDGQDSALLQKHADIALYRAKSLGRNGYQCFSADMLAVESERLRLEAMLRRAVRDRELELHYQPQIDAAGRLVGLEALVRWNHPIQGQISPGKFIPLAEETGLIVDIGEWVLNEACRQNKAWQRCGYPPVRVAVNVSSLQFAQPGFIEVVAAALDRHALDAKWLELEVTESMLMKSMEEAAQKLEQLRKMGVSIAMDDFGTGYSSLSYLQQLPIDMLKIDRSFVDQVQPGVEDQGSGEPGSDKTAVIRAILSLGHSLGMSVTAEGVETEQQVEFLRRNGCDTLQGYFYSKPQPAAKVGALFDRLAGPAIKPAAALSQPA